jgi:hypothetical protein
VRRATWLKKILLLGNLHFSLLLYGLYFYSGEKWCATLLGGLLLNVDDIFLVDKVLYSISLKIGKKKLYIVSSITCFMVVVG